LSCSRGRSRLGSGPLPPVEPILELAEVRSQNEQLGKQLAFLHTPAKLNQLVTELGLGLVPPRPASVVRLLEPVAAAAPETEAALVARSNARPE